MTRKAAGFALLAAGSLLYLACAGEVLYRFADGYRFDSLSLVDRPAVATQPSDDAVRALVEATYFNKKIDPEIFFSPPAVLEEPKNAELSVRTKANPSMQGLENYVWNESYLSHPSEQTQQLLLGQKSDTLFGFKSYDGSDFPRYRFYPGATSNIGTINKWGWLSPDVAVAHPGKTIRVAIVGDSTSHNTYGLYLLGFLKAWGRARHLDLDFELINASHQGFDLNDNIPVLKYEVAPFAVDYVILSHAPSLLFGREALWVAPPSTDTSFPGKRTPPTGQLVTWLKEASGWSALARHVVRFAENDLPNSVLREPRKPRVFLAGPLGQTSSPALDSARKFWSFNFSLAALDEYAKFSRSHGIVPIITTERACAYPGMEINKLTGSYLFDVVNGPVYWPLTYEQVQRILWVENSVIKSWATQNQVAVIDVEANLPHDPSLCSDMMHDLPISQQLRAWIYFQVLTPIIANDVALGHVPRPPPQAEVRSVLEEPIDILNRQDTVAKYKTRAAN